MRRHTVVGTSGHINHGKTALVKALTGMDADRLPEEKERGMTIDLGFAFLGDHITIIDVPGHERFVRNMVAGASTIDMALLVVAADDGVMPQTVEHLEILRYLNIKRGLIALTKIDLVEPDWLQWVKEDIKTLVKGSFLEGAAVISVSSVTDEGIEEARTAILSLAEGSPPRPDGRPFRFPIDRVFTMKGFGTVVTGTVLSGSVKTGDHLVLQPQGREVRIRRLQVHQKEVQDVGPGDRVGINLANVDKEELQRGDVLVTPGYYQPTHMVDARLHISSHAKAPVKHWQRVLFHVGTSEIFARVVTLQGERIEPGNSGLVQLRLESPTITECQDRFVIRQHSPVMTLGGGEILDPSPAKHRLANPELIRRLAILEEGTPESQLVTFFQKNPLVPLRLQDIQRGTRLQTQMLHVLLQEMLKSGRVLQIQGEDYYLLASDLEHFQEKVIEELSDILRRYSFLQGVEINELKTRLSFSWTPAQFEMLLNALALRNVLIRKGSQWSLAGHEPIISPEQQGILDQMMHHFESHPFEVVGNDGFFEQHGTDLEQTSRLFNYLQDQGQIIRLDEKIYISKCDLERGYTVVQKLAETHGEISVGDVRQQLGTTRKYALALLQYFDKLGITRRAGERRVLIAAQRIKPLESNKAA